jgi:hypothetical protein
MNQAGLYFNALSLHREGFGVGRVFPHLLAEQGLSGGISTQPQGSDTSLSDKAYRRGTFPRAGSWFALKGEVYGSANAYQCGTPRGMPYRDYRG